MSKRRPRIKLVSVGGGDDTPPTGKKVISCYVTREQHQLLSELHKATKVPLSVFIREGINMALKARAKDLPDGLPKGFPREDI